MTNAEALLLFKGWRDERKPIACESRVFSNWSFFNRRGFVDLAEDDGTVRIISSDTDAVLGFNVLACEAATYGESPVARTPLIILLLPLRRGELRARKRDSLPFFGLDDAD